MPALRKGTHEGCPYASWFGADIHRGNGPSADGSPYFERPCGCFLSARISFPRSGQALPMGMGRMPIIECRSLPRRETSDN